MYVLKSSQVHHTADELFLRTASLAGSSWIYTRLFSDFNQGCAPLMSPDVALTPCGLIGPLRCEMEHSLSVLINDACIQRIIFQRGHRGKRFTLLKLPQMERT